MANLNSSMSITSEGLSSVSSKIANSREFDSSLIEIKGNPIILNGEASSLNNENYFIKRELDFSNTTEMSILSKAVSGGTEGNSGCLWSLLSPKEEITLEIINGSVTLMSSVYGRLNSITEANIKNGDNLQVQVKVSSNTCSILIFVNNNVFENTRVLQRSIDLQAFNTLYLGKSSKLDTYWLGNVSLREFTILKDNQIYYTPSSGVNFKFTEILISDGSLPLGNASIPILGRIAECPVDEIIRTNNNILLKAYIDEKVVLEIKEVGLYCEINGKRVLFSIIKNLAIDKTSNLGYSLVLHAKLDLNIVNTIIKPEIKILEPSSVKTGEFKRVKDTYYSLIPSIERIIKMNAIGIGSYNCLNDIKSKEGEISTLKNFQEDAVPTRVMSDVKGSGLGYNRAQVFYRLNRELRESKDCYGSILNYALMRERCKLRNDLIFDENKITTVGNVHIRKTGEADNFSLNDYVKTNIYNEQLDSFTFKIAFKANQISDSKETICCFTNYSVNNPLTVFIKNGILCATLGQMEKLVALKDGKQCTFTRGAYTLMVEGQRYYSWNYEGEIQDVPTIIYTTRKSPQISDTLFEIKNEEVIATDLSFNYFTSNLLIDAKLARIELDKITNLKITFDGNYYRFSVAKEGGRYSLTNLFTTPMFINSMNNCYFGVDANNGSISNPATCKIYLKEFLFETSYNKYTLTKYEESSMLELKDFYHFPINQYNSLKISNLEDQNSYLKKNGDIFIGNGDNVDFSRTGGFSLCVKANLIDSKDKIVLLKVNKDSNIHLIKFEIKDLVLRFSMYSNDQEIVLQKKIVREDAHAITENPVLFTITRSKGTYSSTYKLYINEEIADSTVVVPRALTQDFSGGYLTNYEEYKDYGIYVQDIVSFEGELSEQDIHFLCSVFNTRT